MDEWHELEEAKNQIQSEEERERASQAEMASTDSVEARTERALQVLRIQERIEPDGGQTQQLIDTWHPVVCKHLTEIAIATWGEKNPGRYSWNLKGKVIWSEESQTPSLYWVVYRQQPYHYAWYSVELRTDLEAKPLRFVISCKESSYTISADLTVDALKSALVTAFKLGPMDNIFFEDIPGIPIE